MICVSLLAAALVYMGYKYRVYRNYSSGLVIGVMILTSAETAVFAILRLKDSFDTVEKADKARLVDFMADRLLSSLIATLLLLQWLEAYTLLSNPQRARD